MEFDGEYLEITWSWYKNPATNLPIIFILVLVKFEILNFKMKQKLHSWFEANAKFPSTTPAAYMIKSAGFLSQSQPDLSDPTKYIALKLL